MKSLKCEILGNKKYGENLYKMEVFSPYICKNTQPGHFINVKCSFDGIPDPLLRRPFSIYEVDRKFNVFSLLYLVKGRGTSFLTRLKKGDEIDLVGPLGKVFEIEEDVEDYALVGGGIGVAPLAFIAKELIDKGKRCFFFGGFKDSTFYLWERDLMKILRDYRLFTEDGSFGEKGTPAGYLRKNLRDFKKYRFITCGPRDMLKALQDIFDGARITALAIMEERMACGVGTCMGCVIKLKKEKGGFEFKRVCIDGPIFNLMEVVFD